MDKEVTGMNDLAFIVPKTPAYRKPVNGKQEVRGAVRFPLCMEVQVTTDKGVLAASTKNVSACGVLFELAEAIQAGSLIQFTLNMPGAALGLECDVTIQCSGRVVRTVSEGAKHFVASTIDEYEFVERENQPGR